MAIDNYTTSEQLEGSSGNVNFSFNDSTGQFEISSNQADVPEFIDDYQNDTAVDYAIGSTSGIPERSARIIFQQPSSFLYIATGSQDSTSDPFTLYVTNDTTGPIGIAFSSFVSPDSILYPSAISGYSSFAIPAGKTAILFRLSNFEWHVTGQIQSDDLSGGGDTTEQITVTDNISASSDIDVVTPWWSGFVNIDTGDETVQAVDWDGTTSSEYSVSSVDPDLGNRRYLQTNENKLYNGQAFIIWRIDLLDGTEESQFMNNNLSFTESIYSNYIHDSVLYKQSTSSPSGTPDFALQRYDLSQYTAGASNVSWDATQEFSRSGDTSGGQKIHYIDDDYIYGEVQFGGSPTELYIADKDTFSIEKSLLITQPESGNGNVGDPMQLVNNLNKIGDRFYGLFKSIPTGDSFFGVLDKQLNWVDYAFFEGTLIPSNPILIPDKETGIWVIGPNDPELQRYKAGRYVVEPTSDFEVDNGIRREGSIFGPQGLWVRYYDGSNMVMARIDETNPLTVGDIKDSNLSLR